MSKKRLIFALAGAGSYGGSAAGDERCARRDGRSGRRRGHAPDGCRYPAAALKQGVQERVVELKLTPTQRRRRARGERAG